MNTAKLDAVAVALRTAKRHYNQLAASDFATQNMEVAIQLVNELREEAHNEPDTLRSDVQK